MPEQAVILWDDAATKEMHTVWRSANGGIWLEERSARYSGCTHIECHECGEPTPKGWTLCAKCRAKLRLKRHAELPAEPWDESAPVVEHDGDRFFHSWDEVRDYAHEIGSVPLLVHCVPVPVPQVDIDDLLCDWLPPDETADIPPSVAAATEVLNAALRAEMSVVWWGGRVAVADVAAEIGN